MVREANAADRAVKALLKSGHARAVGSCLNIADGDRYEPEEIPVLVLKVEHMSGGVVVARQPYQVQPDRTVRYDQLQIVSRENVIAN